MFQLVALGGIGLGTPPTAQGARAPNAVAKTFVLEGAHAEAALKALGLPPGQDAHLRWRLDAGLEWAVYLRDTKAPDASSHSMERPRFNALAYRASPPRLELSGDWLDHQTGLPRSSGPRFSCGSAFVPEELPGASEWTALIRAAVPTRPAPDDLPVTPRIVHQIEIRGAGGASFALTLYWHVVYVGNQPHRGYTVRVGVDDATR